MGASRHRANGGGASGVARLGKATAAVRASSGAMLILALAVMAAPLQGQVTRSDTTVAEPPGSSPVEELSRPARLVVEGVSLEAAIVALGTASGVSIAYSPALFPAGLRVTCECGDVSVEEAVRRLLAGTELELAAVAAQLVIRRASDVETVMSAAAGTAREREGSLHGIVTDSVTGMPLEPAHVVLDGPQEHLHATWTDRNGYYQIGGIEPGSYTLRVTYLGYATHEESLAFASEESSTVSVRLWPGAVALDEILVSAPGGGAVRREFGRQRVTSADLGRIPVPAASGDLASYLQTLPGVVTTGDRGGQLFVRGGTAAENLVLVDGITIYQPFHILGFFSVFPEDLVSTADFYAGGFGPRYIGRTSSVLDVHMREGSRTSSKVTGSVSPFLVEAVAEGPIASGRASWIASVRRSVIDETSPWLLGARQPLAFESQFVKVSSVDGETGSRCTAMGMRTSDRGRLDPDQTGSQVSWRNTVVGGRCVMLFDGNLSLVDVSFGFSSVENAAVSQGVSDLRSSISHLHHEAHITGLLGTTPIFAGYIIYVEMPEYDLTELFGIQQSHESILGIAPYGEVELTLGERLTVRPGAAVTLSPRLGVEPRVRARFNPRGRSGEELHAALGLYRQDLTGLTDTRDVGAVFVAWDRDRDGVPLESVHATLGWQQELGGGLQWSLEGYYKWIHNVPVPTWNAVAAYDTKLGRADGRVRGLDARFEARHGGLYGFIGYGYTWTEYETAQENFEIWFGEPRQRYHPTQDRRHQFNAMTSLAAAGFKVGARWQLGSGLPFTQPMGFDEAMDLIHDRQDVTRQLGITRVILDRPYGGRLPSVQRLDLWVARPFDLPFGELDVQAGVMNAYNRTNIFYYDLYTNHQVDQLPLAPYLSLKLRTQ